MRKYFYGTKISEKEIEVGYISYATLASTFNHVLNNEIIKYDIENWEIYHGYDYSYDCDIEIYQYYIIDYNGVDILSNETDEIVLYNSNLDVYLWGVTHYGTGWDYVSTNISIQEGE